MWWLSFCSWSQKHKRFYLGAFASIFHNLRFSYVHFANEAKAPSTHFPFAPRTRIKITPRIKIEFSVYIEGPFLPED